MRLLELFDRQYLEDRIQGILSDGPIKVAKHFMDQFNDPRRKVPEGYLLTTIKIMLKKNKKELEAMEVDTPFILKNKSGLGIPGEKIERPDGSIYYNLGTMHPNLRKRVSQRIFTDSVELDKPTPTVGDLAEKYHCSLLAVEQQLKKGIKAEMEHTSHWKVAKEIALDHLGEDLYYYKKLGKIEKTDESCSPECTCPKCKGKKKG